MRNGRITVAAVVLLLPGLFALSASGQSFTNLNFESANVPILAPGEPGGPVPVGMAMPGWNVFFGGQQQPAVIYNDQTLGSSAVSLFGPNFQFFGVPVPTIQGSFSAFLVSGDGAPVVNPASISQTGLVPAGSESIQARILGDAPFVSLNGTEITMYPLQTFPGYTLYGGDVSGFAGQVANLTFSALPTPSDPFRGFQLDSILFSPTPVPEPSVFALLTIAGLGFGFHRWRTSKRI